MDAKRRPAFLTEPVLDGLGAAIFTAGTAGLLGHLRGYATPFWQIACLSVLLVSLIALLSRRWWLAPLAMAGLGLLGAGLFLAGQAWLPDRLARILAASADALLALRGLVTPGAPAPAAHWLLTAVLLLPLAVLFWLLVRTVNRMTVYLVLTAASLVPALVWYPDALPYFLVIAGGFLIQVPRFFASAVQREHPQQAVLPRVPMQLLAVPAAAVCLLLANWLIPAQTLNWRLAPLAHWVHDVQDLWQNNLGEGRTWPAFSLAGYGYGNAGVRLGGPVRLDRSPVLWMQADRAVLLKGSTRAIYTGSSWQRSAQPVYRLDSPLWRSQRQQVLGESGSRAAGSVRAAFVQAWGQPLSLQISHQQHLTTLFSAGAVQQVRVRQSLRYAPYFTVDGDLFTFEIQPYQFTYTIETLLLDRLKSGFDQALLTAESDLAAAGDEQWTAVTALYRQLPDPLPAQVAATARLATAGATTPYRQALRLEAYLQAFGTYTLQPDLPPDGAEFVDYFLTSGQGTCVYYATAMAVMARTMGIPSRYVEGFTVDAVPGSGAYQATGQNAHAWCELYFQGLGWLAFDPTPGGSAAAPAVPSEPLPSAAVGPTPGPTDEPGIPGSPLPTGGWGWLLILLLILTALVLRLLYGLANRRHRLRFQPAWLRQHYPDPARQLNFLYQDVLQQLACLGLAPEKGETLQQFAARCEPFVRIETLSLPTAFWPVARLRYGQHRPTDAELAGLRAIRTHLEDRLRNNLTSIAYFVQRVFR